VLVELLCELERGLHARLVGGEVDLHDQQLTYPLPHCDECSLSELRTGGEAQGHIECVEGRRLLEGILGCAKGGLA